MSELGLGSGVLTGPDEWQTGEQDASEVLVPTHCSAAELGASRTGGLDLRPTVRKIVG